MCRSKADGGRRWQEAGTGGDPAPAALRDSSRRAGGTAGRAGLPRLTPRRAAALRQAAAHPRGGFPPMTARDEEALEQLGYAASIDDCGHVNTDPAATSHSEHRGHPHFLRITPAGRAAAGHDTARTAPAPRPPDPRRTRTPRRPPAPGRPEHAPEL